jgi:hypothetical protein|tara:strand:+ start:5250 stop:7043 length:1794 start_codon:yes stop_codon:yes gene_type:complete
MLLGILTFLSALTISAVAIYYSVAGLTAIFAAAVIPIIIMGTALEIGKLVTAVWLHRNWTRAVWWLKTYLSVAVFVLMFITSMGIFGYLSKAHIEQTSMSQEQVALIETLDDKLVRSQAKIERWTDEMNRLMKGEDVRVDNLIDREQEELDKINALIKAEKDDVRKDFDKQIKLQNDRIEQARIRKESDIQAAKDRFEGSFGGGAKFDKAVEEAKANELSVASSAQREIRNINAKLNEALAAVDAKYANDIKTIQDRIQDLRNQANAKTEDIDGRITELEGFIDAEQLKVDATREEKFTYEKTYRALEAEVGPIKYIAEFIYGERADQDLLEAAVRWVIIIIIFVFDPLAVLLLIASQYTFMWYRDEKGLNGPGGGSTPPKPDPVDPDPKWTDEEWNEAHRLNDEFNRKRDEQLRAEKIATNIPPEIEKRFPLLKMTEEEEYRNAGITKEEAEKTTSQMLQEGFEQEQAEREKEEAMDVEQEIQEAIEDDKQIKDAVEDDSEMQEVLDEIEDKDVAEIEELDNQPEEDDLDKWNNWVEKANEEAEKNPEEPTEGLPETKNMIFYNKEIEDQKKRANKTSYITKVDNKQVRKKTNPED